MSEFRRYGKIVVDIDGTLCENTDGKDYENASPKWDVIETVRRYFQAGYEVTIFTARGMQRFDGDAEMCDRMLRPITEKWLRRHSVPYYRLIFGKPSSDLYIDDKGIRPDEFTSLEP